MTQRKSRKGDPAIQPNPKKRGQCHICGGGATWDCSGEYKECSRCRRRKDAKELHWAAIGEERKAKGENRDRLWYSGGGDSRLSQGGRGG